MKEQQKSTNSRARKNLGDAGERMATEQLKMLGYDIIENNWRCKAGEIDIVARQGEELVFVEVRARRGNAMGTPEESVNARKQATLLKVAEAYLNANPALLDARGEPPRCRFDLVAVELDNTGLVLRVEVLENIIQG